VKKFDSDVLLVVGGVAAALSAGFDLSRDQQTKLEWLLLQLPDLPTPTLAVAGSAIAQLRARIQDDAALDHLLGSAQAILDHESEAWAFSVESRASAGRFYDVDLIWEYAVAGLLRPRAEALGWNVMTHPWRGTRTTLFDDGGPNVDPDILVNQNGAATLVVDAKNKIVSKPLSNDIYQVVCYARRASAARAAIVYLTDGESWTESMGDDGVAITAIGVSMDGLEIQAIALGDQLLNSASPA
jgi:hypothetical protein